MESKEISVDWRFSFAGVGAVAAIGDYTLHSKKNKREEQEEKKEEKEVKNLITILRKIYMKTSAAKRQSRLKSCL